jgi:hypothetical protein
VDETTSGTPWYTTIGHVLRTKVIPRFPTERSCLALLFASLATASKRWRGVKMTPAAIKQLQLLRTEAATPFGQKAVA